MKRVLFVILAVLIVATTGVHAIYVRDLTAARVRLVGRSNTIETFFGTLSGLKQVYAVAFHTYPRPISFTRSEPSPCASHL
jgi:uncharacterized protein YxeA